MTSIRKLGRGDEAALERFLRPRAETSMFLRSNLRAAGTAYQPKKYHGDYFGAVKRDGSMTGVVAHYWNGVIIMQAADVRILSRLIDHLRGATTRAVAGVNGPDDQVLNVIAGLALPKADFAINTAEALYTLKLESLILPATPRGQDWRMIDGEKVEPPVLRAWIKAYEMEALGANDDAQLDARVEDRVRDWIHGTNGWALSVDGRPVSLVGFNARLPDMVQVGPVWTPPEYRSKGYARTLLAMALGNARHEGVEKAILFTGHAAGARAYEAIGFRRIGAYRLAMLKKPVDV